MNGMSYCEVSRVIRFINGELNSEPFDIDIDIEKLRLLKMGKVVLTVKYGRKSYNVSNIFFNIIVHPENRRLRNLIQKALEVV